MIIGNKVKLRDKRLSDARNDYVWQTDPELVQLDAAPTLTIPFPKYLAEYAIHLRYPAPTRHIFAIETLDSKHIGNCTYYNVDETDGEAELGIIIGDRNYWDKGYGTDVITTLVDYIFLETNLKRLYLKTLDWNVRAHKCFKKCGLAPYGHINQDGYSFVVMELRRKQWEEWRSERDS